MSKISFFSFSRSDYTSLSPLIRMALKEHRLKVEVVAGGSHLLERFGKTISAFKLDDIPIHTCCDFMRENDDSDTDIARAAGLEYEQVLNYLISSQPDFVFILGDRWEMLPVAQAAFLLRIPILHHSGGDVTQGALDNQVRYSLSCLSHFHFTALEEHSQRLLKMGEESWRVKTVGEPALTEIKCLALDRDQFYQMAGLEKNESFILATFHPTTYDSIPPKDQISVFLKTLEMIPEAIILTAPNPDPGSMFFLNELEKFSKLHPRVKLHKSLGARLYYAAMASATFMVGNSSSGIWEAPSFELPVLNLGDRQSDRVRAVNVIDVSLNLNEIENGLKKIRNQTFRSNLEGMQNPYGNESVNTIVLETIFGLPSRDKMLKKCLIDPLRMSNG